MEEKAGRRVFSGILEKALLRQGTCDTETDDSDMVTLENASCRRPKKWIFKSYV